MKILAHTSFIGDTGYANHARSFFVALNKHHQVKVRNMTIGKGWEGYTNNAHDKEEYITDEMKEMLILQTLNDPHGGKTDYPLYGYNGDFKADIHIVLNDVDNPYFYDTYEGYKIAYNVYESTRYPDNFFKRLHYFDEVWVPSEWQRTSLIEQGYPAERVSVVPEGVDASVFKPKPRIAKSDTFKFLLFGRWDYRKSTTEIINAFGELYGNREDVELICSVENPFATDGFATTEERAAYYGVHFNNVKFVKFPSRAEYVEYLQNGSVFLSCARSEGWNLPLIEAMACGTPSIYSDYSGQLQFASGKGIPVKISHIRAANIGDKEVAGDYCEPDFEDLKVKMSYAYKNHKKLRTQARKEAISIHNEFNWGVIAENAAKMVEGKQGTGDNGFAFVTTGNSGYMPVIEKLVQSLKEFSDSKILVYGVGCDVPFDYPNVIRKRIDPPTISKNDKWYWKQFACAESLKEGFDNYVWIDGDVVVNHNIDEIAKHFKDIENYPISDIHVQTEYFAPYHGDKTQLFNEELSKEWNIEKSNPYMHVCLFVYNKKCVGWFDEIINHYVACAPEDYDRLYLWNDEGIDNAMRWKYGYKKHLPLSNFDTSSYEGDAGYTDQTMHQFYKFWNEDGEQNFDRIFGFQFIPKDKNEILYFHGNKNAQVSDEMVTFIKMMRDNSFYQSEYFYTDVYKLENLGDIKGLEGATMDVAKTHDWFRAIYHEIYNLLDYYKNRERAIFEGDVVVDLGGNVGVFNRWAYSQGASKVISFEPDRRYFKLLSLNADPRSILFNAAASNEVGELVINETGHLGGSTILLTDEITNSYTVRSYTLDYLFETGVLDKIDFLKVDIEGAEHHALNGISDENLMKVRNISMEYHHALFNYDEELRGDLVGRLVGLGFSPYTLFLGSNNALQMLYFKR
jgi:FkbM family methyltransferase